MHFVKLPVNERAVKMNRDVERVVNRAVRTYDAVMGKLRLGGRRAAYDDEAYEFIGGAKDELRRKHYDKSLRLLWKAEHAAPWSTFKDAGEAEKALMNAAERAMTDAERAARAKITSKEFRAALDREYTPEQKRALVSILSKIGHGEAYAWLVSASMLNEVKSTGARAAVTMQVMEEAKHFVVLRELIQAFDVPIPRQSAWDYLLLEGCLRAKGLDRFFGMNVLVETIALSIFGLLSDKPGLEVLRLFHLDESRHTALPDNYFREFPLTEWQKRNPAARVSRLVMALPAVPLVLFLEAELAELGVDVFEFAGSILRKAVHLAERAGFLLPLPGPQLLSVFNRIFNAYCSVTRGDHQFREYMSADTTHGAAEAAVEKEIFGAAA
ncbi:MAG: hypothetical protein HYV09_00570 [Deltaproteobacteria bacterium]|nr:hypothetical protein [Deltaproteobacteria bacterium]